jgi:iron complex transport system ATP-binding protein
MVSHDINLAAMYGDTLLLLKDGKIVHQGSPEDVLTFQMLEKTYDCTLLVDESPLGKFPRITPVPGKFIKS